MMTQATEVDLRAEQLARMKRRATALLLAVTVAFVLLLLIPDGSPTWLGYALAAAEGSMVGGLADWFAVTALFRHPLGLPIPHTAIIRERKDQFGQTLGDFVQENFLNAEVVGDRIRAAGAPARLAAWLSDEQHAERVSDAMLDAVVTAVDTVGEEQVAALIGLEIERAVAAAPVARMAGGALDSALDSGAHRPMVDAVLRGARSFLRDQRGPLHARFGEASPWWLPESMGDRFFDRFLDEVQLLLTAVAADPEHPLRRELDARLVVLAGRLRDDPSLAERVEGAVRDVLASPSFHDWTSGLAHELIAQLRTGTAPDGAPSDVRDRLTGAVMSMGRRLRDDAALQERLSSTAETAVRHLVTHHRAEVTSLIADTIARWDADETSDKLELLLGRDLQFIRINGTVVGGLAGVALHAVATLLS